MSVKRATVRTTTLEGFRYWQTGGLTRYDDSAPDDLEAYLANTNAPPSAAMARGTELHSLIEHAKIGDEFEEHRSNCGLWRFGFGDIDVDLEVPTVHEASLRKTYQIGDVALTVTGHADGISAKCIKDWKTTSIYKWESYHDSLQWKVYCDMYLSIMFCSLPTTKRILTPTTSKLRYTLRRVRKYSTTGCVGGLTLFR
jgi:hypothetical protein